MSMLSIGKVCQLLGISLSTAYRWIKSGKLKERYKTVGQPRRFCEAEVRTLFLSDKVEDEKIHVAVYVRVSSHDQKEDLVRQRDRLLNHCKEQGYTDVEIISDLGSGLNDKKSGLSKLLKLILSRSINVLVIHHKDRLLRFGSELIFKLCHFHGIKIVMMEDMADKSFEENLSADVIELMTVFCARL